jgi:hypothetical protein
MAPFIPRWLQWEVSAGGGFGSFHHEITPMGGMTRTADDDATKVFIMPTLGVTTTYFDVAGSVRMVGVSYGTVSASANYTMQQLSDDKFADLSGKMWLFAEPVITLRGGYKWIKLQLDIGKSFKLSSGDLNYNSGMFTIALNVDVWRAFGRRD